MSDGVPGEAPPDRAGPVRVQAPVRVEVHGHRGARGLRPENTLPGFAYALDLGVDALELDVGLTADGVVVLNHDQTLSAVTTRDTEPSRPGDPLFPYVGRRLRDLTLAQIKTVDAGTRRPDGAVLPGGDPFLLTQLPVPGVRLPTLIEVCALLDRLDATTPRLHIELKTDPDWPDAEVARLVTAVAEIMEVYGLLARTRLLGFDWRVLTHARRLVPEAGRVALVEDRTLTAGSAWLAGHPAPERVSDVAAAALAAGATVLSPEHTLTGPELVAESHRLGLPVAVWTVNEPAEMDAFADLGVDAIVTDYPDRLRAVLAARSLPLPPRYRRLRVTVPTAAP